MAVDEERIARNPAARVPASRIEQAEPWVLTPDEVERVADEVGERWRALVLLAAYSSLRWSELVALRVSRLDLIRAAAPGRGEDRGAWPAHRGRAEDAPVPPVGSIPESVVFEVAEHLRRFPPGPDGLVFMAPEGGPVRRPHFGDAVWRPAVKRAGLKGFRFGNLRHTGASLPSGPRRPRAGRNGDGADALPAPAVEAGNPA